jgi:hypothetical protein
VASSLEDTMCSTSRDRVDPAVNETLSDTNRGDLESFSTLIIIVFCIVYSTFDNIVDDDSTFFWHESECIECLLRSHITNDVSNDIEFFWRDTDISYRSFHKKKFNRCVV